MPGDIKLLALGGKGIFTAKEKSNLVNCIIDCFKKFHELGLQKASELATGNNLLWVL